MSDPAKQLARARDARDAAKAAFDAKLAELRGDSEAQSIGERVKERLADDARAAFYQALDVASESKGIIAGTVAALALWFLRRPIIAWLERLWSDDTDNDETDTCKAKSDA